jgi:GNAT superfamily N-acetyltransferase
VSCEIRVLEAGDEALLSDAVPGVFDHAVVPALAREFLADPRHHIAVAVVDGRVVGFASAVHYVHPDKPAELWINEVGLALAFRRRGLGRQLLQTLFRVGTALGCAEAWVLTDRANLGAQALYASVGGTEGVGGSGGANPIIGYSFPLGAGR